ncbi:MAG: DUF2804 domain-containing protein [Myxococcota bacterium]|jgi:hypothetical protein|nr:DUF2804 domain-containing protein [Myxococcota bacterium]
MVELTSSVDLCGAKGLNRAAVGWSRRPLHGCALNGASRLRQKKWNYWAITTQTHLFSVTVSDIGYAGLAFIYLVDFDRGAFHEETVLVPLARGFDLPETVDADVQFGRCGLAISMLHSDGPDGHRVRHEVEMPGFMGRGLRADFVVSYPEGHDTLNVVVPWDDRHFQFTAKHNTLPTIGSVRLGAGGSEGAQEVRFEGPQAFACLDYGRGVWPYRCAWNWGAASGREGDRTVGLNLGGKWTDGTGATENALCIDGDLTKVDEDLVWEYDTRDWMKPWKIRTPDAQAIDLEFTPMLERVATTNALIVRSEVHQMFGHYQGVVRDATGQAVEVEHLVGWAEDHRAAW